jgi:hypothetical protein
MAKNQMPRKEPAFWNLSIQPSGEQLLNNPREIDTARHKRKWRAVEKSVDVKHFPLLPPTARHFEKWQPVAKTSRKSANFQVSDPLWRAVVAECRSVEQVFARWLVLIRRSAKEFLGTWFLELGS